MKTSPFTRQLCALLLLAMGVVGTALGEEQLELRISGLKGEPLDNVRASLSLERHRLQGGLSAETIRRLHAQAPGEIARALEPFGYYRPKVDAQLREPARQGEAWRAGYRIDIGPPVPIAALEIGFEGPGAQDPAAAALASGLPLQSDPTLDHRRYESAKQELVNGLRELGYLDAVLARHRVEVDVEAYTARIQLQVNSGSRYVFGPVEFEQDRFDPAYLARYLILEPGAPYSRTQLTRQRELLSKSGHFRSVEIQPLPATGDQPPAIPLRIVLETYLPNRYRGSLGWGTDTGVGVQLDWTRRYVGGRGQRFNLGGAAAEDRNRLAGNLSYLIPLEPLEGSQIELIARHESKDLTYEDVELDRGGDTRIATNLLTALWHRPRILWGDFELAHAPGLNLVTESYDIFEVLFGHFPQEDQEFFIDNVLGREAYGILTPDFEAVAPSLRFSLRRSDDRLFIRRGDYLSLILLGAHEDLGSNISFWQARMQSWHIRPLFGSGRLLLRTALGYSEAEDETVLGVNFNQMPEYYEFRAGGARSVRGYGFEELYPEDTITGGKHQLVGSIEYEHEIIPKWSLAAFLDGGNAFNNFDDIDPKLGTGLGVRWRSPVGLARIDLGIPLDDADDSFQIYITVGPEF